MAPRRTNTQEDADSKPTIKATWSSHEGIAPPIAAITNANTINTPPKHPQMDNSKRPSDGPRRAQSGSGLGAASSSTTRGAAYGFNSSDMTTSARYWERNEFRSTCRSSPSTPSVATSEVRSSALPWRGRRRWRPPPEGPRWASRRRPGRRRDAWGSGPRR